MKIYNKNYIKTISISLVFTLMLLILYPISAAASEYNYYIPSLDDNFADNRVIVIFDNETSMSFNNYQTSDFSSISCERVIDLSAPVAAKIKNAINNITLHVTEGIELEQYSGIGFDEFNQIICLE